MHHSRSSDGMANTPTVPQHGDEGLPPRLEVTTPLHSVRYLHHEACHGKEIARVRLVHHLTDSCRDRHLLLDALGFHL